jgi:hypothetical protein
MVKKFQTYFYMKTLVDYDYNMKKFKTHWYILVFSPFESIKNLIAIGLSSYFHILETKVGHMFSCTCIFLNVLKCILKHAIMSWPTSCNGKTVQQTFPF